MDSTERDLECPLCYQPLRLGDFGPGFDPELELQLLCPEGDRWSVGAVLVGSAGGRSY